MQSFPGFSSELIKWYQANRRDLPWRHTRDPYKIWVSEIILQQTRVQQGLPYYERFVTTFPTVTALANAPLDELLRLWQGLGYYSRARNMHAAAMQITSVFNGQFPESFEKLLNLKGVGRYTAAAIASFAYGEKVPVVDGNVQRVLSRIFGITEDITSPKTQKIFEQRAAELISEKDPASFNQAIMEFGSQFCVPAKPDCPSCIFRSLCFAYQHKMVDQLPVKLKKTKVRDRYFSYIVFRSGNLLAMKQRVEKDIWSGLFEFYLIESEKAISENQVILELEQKGLGVKSFRNISSSFRHILSHQKINAVFYMADVENIRKENFGEMRFYTEVEIENLAKPVLILNYLVQQKIL